MRVRLWSNLKPPWESLSPNHPLQYRCPSAQWVWRDREVAGRWSQRWQEGNQGEHNHIPPPPSYLQEPHTAWGSLSYWNTCSACASPTIPITGPQYRTCSTSSNSFWGQAGGWFLTSKVQTDGKFLHWVWWPESKGSDASVTNTISSLSSPSLCFLLIALTPTDSLRKYRNCACK